MPFSMLPKTIYPKLTDISPSDLQTGGIRLLMLDFDNTVLPYTSNEPSDELLSWFRIMQEAGIALCVVSNSKKPRALPLCGQLGIGCVRNAKKPFSKGIKACLAQYGVPAAEAALVGDQIYTDVLGANCAGVRSILVKPIHLHNIWLKLRHVAEQPFILSARKRRVKR